MIRAVVLTSAIAVIASPLSAQTTDGEYYDAFSPSMASVVKSMYGTIRRDLVEAAQQMPEDEYAFKPTPEVRSFGELVSHVAAANLLFSSQAKGDSPKFPAAMQAMTKKSDLVKLLNDALTYCDESYGATTDQNFGTVMKVIGSKPSEATRGAILFFNTTHNNEHYGNMVVYMRLKGHIPPSTTRGEAAAARK
jgi:uncharacterized damage-inducible protein DinB